MDSVRVNAAEHRSALVLLTQLYVDGGIQRFNRTFLSACDCLNLSCEVLSLGDSEDSRGRWTEPGSVNVRVFDHDKVRFSLATLGAVLRGAHDFIVIGHVNLLNLVMGCLAVRGRRRPRVFLIAHGIEVWTGLEGWWTRRALARVDRILSVSRYTSERIRAQCPGVRTSQLTIFPNALSETWTRRFAQAGGPAVGLLRLPPKFLLSVTRLDRGDRYKGITTVLESLTMLEDATVGYVIAGRGDDQEFLRNLVRRLNLEDRVHFVGAVSDAQLARLYAECAVFVLPSGKEGFGIVFLEAMYFGAPVIAAGEKGALDVVSQEETGLLVPYGDTVALSSAITRVLRDRTLRTRLKRKGRESVVDDGPFTFRAYVSRLAAVTGVPFTSASIPRDELIADRVSGAS